MSGFDFPNNTSTENPSSTGMEELIYQSFSSNQYTPPDNGCTVTENSTDTSSEDSSTFVSDFANYWNTISDPFVLKFRSEQKLVLQRDQLVSALAVSESVPFSDISSDITNAFGKKSPISMLMEHAQYSKSRVNFVEIGQPDGPDHKPTFTMVAVVNGRPFTRVQAGTKRDCRTGAAYLAWKTIILEEQERLRQLLSDESVSLDDYMACLTHLEYLIQVERNPLAFCGRRILSAILMCQTNPASKRRPAVTVLSLGTGNRCILSSHLSLDGVSVNDSHAEVIARRAFLRYLYQELQKFRAGRGLETIFEPSVPSGRCTLRLKEGITFHLYISSSPCGDASLFSREKSKCGSEENSETEDLSQEPLFTSSVQGLLRTKIEAGEGSIPVEKNYFQTWIGLLFGNRLRTMCCSDKILKWNVVGLQGALLTRFIEPIYLSSIIIGENFIYGHVARALHHRLTKDETSPIRLSDGYQVVCPELAQTKIGTLFGQETEKSSALAVVWYLGIEKAEVIDGTTGKFVNEDGVDGIPCICKKSMFDEYRLLCADLRQPNPAETYFASKQLMTNYQNSKTEFYDRMASQGYGDWVTKPLEIDYFP